MVPLILVGGRVLRSFEAGIGVAVIASKSQLVVNNSVMFSSVKPAVKQAQEPSNSTGDLLMMCQPPMGH